jgi:hypothetical protein
MEEKIEVRAYRLNLPEDPVHLSVIYTDKYGQKHIVRGGPSAPDNVSLSRPLGHIKTEHGRYVFGAPDWTTKVVPSVVIARGVNLRQTFDNMRLQADMIEAHRIPYHPWEQNSNSVVRTVVENSGLTFRLPRVNGREVLAPAHEVRLMDRNGFRLVHLQESEATTAASLDSGEFNYSMLVEHARLAVGAQRIWGPRSELQIENNEQQVSQPNNNSRAPDLAERQQTYNEYTMFVRSALAPNAPEESLHRAISYTLAQEGYPPQYRAEVIVAGMSDTGRSQEQDLAYVRGIAAWPEQRQMPQPEPVVASAQLER